MSFCSFIKNNLIFDSDLFIDQKDIFILWEKFNGSSRGKIKLVKLLINDYNIKQTNYPKKLVGVGLKKYIEGITPYQQALLDLEFKKLETSKQLKEMDLKIEEKKLETLQKIKEMEMIYYKTNNNRIKFSEPKLIEFNDIILLENDDNISECNSCEEKDELKIQQVQTNVYKFCDKCNKNYKDNGSINEYLNKYFIKELTALKLKLNPNLIKNNHESKRSD